MTRIMPADIVVPARTQAAKIFRAIWFAGIGIVILALVFASMHWLISPSQPPVSPAANAAPSTPNVLHTLPAPASASLGWWNAMPQQVQFLIMGLMVVALIAVARSAFKGMSSSSILKPKSFFSQVITSLLVAALLFAVLYPLNPTAALWTSDEGHFHLMMYALAIIASVLIAKNLEGFGWFSAIAILVVVFALLGPRTLMLYDPVLAGKFHSRGNGSSTQVASSITAPGCPIPGQQLTWNFGSTPQKINAEAKCNVQFYLHDHCLMVRRAAKTGDSKPYPVCTGQFPNDIEWAWTTSAPFTAEVVYSALPYRS